MKNTGQSGGIPGVDVGLLGAWEFTTGSNQVKVAILMAAAYPDHPDFVPAVGVSRIVPDEDPWGFSPEGTSIAGIIAAEANNGGTVKRGIAGIDQGCAVLNYAYEEELWPWSRTNGDNIRDATDAGADVINLTGVFVDPGDAEGEALAYAYKHDVVLVAPTGNDGGLYSYYPAAFDGVIGVGSIRDDRQRGSLSNYGPVVDLVAPDGDTSSQSVHWLTSLVPPAGYAKVFNTWYACAHVTGAASLLRAAYPELPNDDIANILFLSAKDYGDPGRDDQFGYGLVKIDSAFRLLESPNTLRHLPVTSPPSVYSVSDLYACAFHDAPGLASGVYLVKRYEVRAAVSFPALYYHFAGAWGRGNSTTGFSAGSPNLGIGFAEFVPGTLTPTGGTIRTYVYEMWELADGYYIGFRPCAPANVSIAYSALGEEVLETPTLYGTVQGTGHRLSWSDVLEAESNWHVDRKEGTGTWQVDYAILPANSTSFVDSAGGLIGSELYEYRIYPSSPHQTGSGSNVVSLRAKPKAPSCVSGYVVQMNPIAAHPVEYCSACNTSECGGMGGGIEMLGGEFLGEESLGGEEMMQAIGNPPGCPSQCLKTNMLVVEWSQPENQVLGAIEGYRVARFDDEQQPFWTYGDLTTFLADTMCSELSSESFELGVITIDVYGDTSSRTIQVYLTTGSLDYCGGYGIPQEKIVAGADALPESFALHQNHPNPFNSGTVIEYDLPASSNVTLEVFDVLGRPVVELAHGQMPPGKHAMAWDGRNSNGVAAASGIYFYRITTEGFVQTKKLVILR